MPRYLIIGDTGIDHIQLPSGERLPPLCGGAALYAAIGCAIWDRSVGIVSVVNASFPQSWLDAFADAGIDIKGIRRSRFPMGLEVAFTYHADGSRSGMPGNAMVAWWMNRFPRLFRVVGTVIINRFISPHPMDIPAAYTHAEAVHLTPMLPARQRAFIQWAQGRCSTADLFAPSRMDYPPLSVLPPLHLLQALLPSAEEIAEVYPKQLLPGAIQDLHQRGAPVVCVKRGPAGAVVSSASLPALHSVPIYPCTVRDVTGAGDAFCGGFLAGLHETGDPYLAALYGTVSASFVIEGYSALFGLAFSRAHAEARLETLIRRATTP